MSKWVGLLIIILLLGGGLGYYFWQKENINPVGTMKPANELYLEKYDFDNLRKYLSGGGEIEVLGEIKEVNERRKEKKDFTTREIRFKSGGKWISGMMNYYPEKSSLSPVIIMVRGYAEKIGYYPGSGTWRVADELAKAGYVTISLDFLGYGHSDMESLDMLEGRFHKVVEVLDLLAAVKQLPWVDKTRIGFWAHSNGGQIVLSVLEITGERYPAVLWAPMTRPFPESVLSTIDPGSPVEAAIEEFQQHYDARRYAFENYYEWINSPILIQQGTGDDQVMVQWQQELQSRLLSLNKEIKLVVYEGADHNLKGSWEEAVKTDIGWFGEK